MSKLYFRYGAMNCGKSTNLLQVAHNYEERGMNVLILKPRTDTKGGDRILSRLGVTRKVDFLIDKDQDLFKLMEEYVKGKKVDCILVDEAQFMKKHHIDEMFSISVNLDIPVICYGLRTDFMMNGFEGSERLLLLAHSIEELKTICKCGKKAMLNGRLINGEFVFQGDQVAIDRVDNVEYIALCPKCYFEFKEKYEKSRSKV
jgi:thymidine kinase